MMSLACSDPRKWIRSRATVITQPVAVRETVAPVPVELVRGRALIGLPGSPKPTLEVWDRFREAR